MRYFIITIVLFSILINNIFAQEIEGIYKSNFSIFGEYFTEIKFNKSNFNYLFTVGSFTEKASGSYQSSGDTLKLNYTNFERDSIQRFEYFNKSKLEMDSIEISIKWENLYDYRLPERLLIRNDKLFIIDNQNELREKEIEKLILFGKIKKKRKYYLLKE